MEIHLKKKQNKQNLQTIKQKNEEFYEFFFIDNRAFFRKTDSKSSNRSTWK